jgi:hypothetical protein
VFTYSESTECTPSATDTAHMSAGILLLLESFQSHLKLVHCWPLISNPGFIGRLSKGMYDMGDHNISDERGPWAMRQQE